MTLRREFAKAKETLFSVKSTWEEAAWRGRAVSLGKDHSEDKSLYLANGHSRSNFVQLHIFVVHGGGGDVDARSGSINEEGFAYRGV